ncbi:flavin reductase [Pyrodictium occultum]|uniref:Flavin reductase n=1 Tax=Pyrodictium occultum TaxID=2309 RepID=A0A0V8RU09_PYROC|nr:flavin reductase family protein [Pyrodictium occultum]KSW11474.1 flavin reductase [Pyrodictium occultum]
MPGLPSGYVDAGEKWYRVLSPRPVYVLVAEARGRVNLMPASWVSPFSEEPPRIVAALDKEAYTTELILESRLFTVNVVTVGEVYFVYTAGTTSGRRVDKLRLLGAEVVRDTVTGAPRLAKPRPIGVVEARVHRVLSDLAEDVHLVVADVEAAYTDPGLYNQRYGWELGKARILLHSAGRAFTTVCGVYTPRRSRGNA